MLKRFVSPAPALVSLPLKKPSHPYISSQFIVPDSLLNGTTPKLAHLDLHGCSIGWKSPLLKGLQTLKTCTLNAQETPTLNDWSAGLKEMSQLKMLTVHDATPTISVDNPHNPGPQRPVTLSSLTHFNIIASARDCSLALAHLVFPALISLHVDAHSESGDGEDVRLLIPYVTRNAHGPQDTAPLQTILLNGDEMHAEIVAWAVPDADLGVRNSVTLEKAAVSARLDFSVMSYRGWRDGMEAEIFGAMLSPFPLNAI